LISTTYILQAKSTFLLTLKIENIVQALEQEHRACYACPVACGVISKVKKGDYKGTQTGGPMAEAYWNWGWKCGITDVDAICKITDLCNKNGIRKGIMAG